jgi:hypothetical protein
MPGLIEMAQRKWTKVASRSVRAVKFCISDLMQVGVVAQVNAHDSDAVFVRRH